ncbi:MAG: hypothetical protein HY903_24745 [Deltaproteobacteria bacterium]|nr:hypothetical protein [Deltaproteobacteria bacterium]
MSTATAIAEALFARPDAPPSASRLAAFDVELRLHFRHCGAFARTVFGLALFVLAWLAPLWCGRLPPLARLPLARRIAVLSKIEHSPLQAAFFAVKAIFCLIYFEDRGAAVEIGADTPAWSVRR